MKANNIYCKTLLATLCVVAAIGCGKGESSGPVTPPTPPSPSGDTASTTGISEAFDADRNIFSLNTRLVEDTAMQGFSIEADKATVWYTLVSPSHPERLYFIKAKPNTSADEAVANTEYMTLTYCGHGTNTAVEESGNDRYLWAGTYGSYQASDNKYWGEQLVGRIKFAAGKTAKPNEMECFYIGEGRQDVQPSIDAENNLLTINYNDSAYSAYRCFVIYKLDEALKAPYDNITITCTDGFETDKPASTNKVSKTVRVHDLTKIAEVARPRFLKQGYGPVGSTYYDWQGYDVHGNRLYYAEGQSNYNLSNPHTYFSGKSYAYITIFDTATSKVIEERTQVAFVSDKETTAAIGVSTTGTLESEGVKVYGDKMYLGFTARQRTSGNTKHYQNIFVFDAAKK